VRDTHHTVCMLLGWQRICSRFYESKRLRENIYESSEQKEFQ
jgi:hypothetical protein